MAPASVLGIYTNSLLDQVSVRNEETQISASYDENDKTKEAALSGAAPFSSREE